ncbi:MAG: 2-amino-4-hydroxy-6-hydroxymethyldihydropteridine diphosphokinase [Woeseia sp.]
MKRARPHWWPAYIGLGSNLDDPVAQIDKAFAALDTLKDSQLLLRSPKYGSAPLGPQDQPDYVNAVAGILTTLSPEELLVQLQAIEKQQGRVRSGERWGARTLDLDLLVYGSEVIDSPNLQVPHPRIAERNFVLLPLNDIAPELRIPGYATVARLAAAISFREPRIARLD